MMADPVVRAVSAAFPALCVLCLALPFVAEWPVGGTLCTALLPSVASQTPAGLTSRTP